jgi:hypothetical protein
MIKIIIEDDKFSIEAGEKNLGVMFTDSKFLLNRVVPCVYISDFPDKVTVLETRIILNESSTIAQNASSLI